MGEEKIGPHDTSPQRLRQIANDLWSEGWYTWAGTIAQVADEIEARKPNKLIPGTPTPISTITVRTP